MRKFRISTLRYIRFSTCGGAGVEIFFTLALSVVCQLRLLIASLRKKKKQNATNYVATPRTHFQKALTMARRNLMTFPFVYTNRTHLFGNANSTKTISLYAAPLHTRMPHVDKFARKVYKTNSPRIREHRYSSRRRQISSRQRLRGNR